MLHQSHRTLTTQQEDRDQDVFPELRHSNGEMPWPPIDRWRFSRTSQRAESHQFGTPSFKLLRASMWVPVSCYDGGFGVRRRPPRISREERIHHELERLAREALVGSRRASCRLPRGFKTGLGVVGSRHPCQRHFPGACCAASAAYLKYQPAILREQKLFDWRQSLARRISPNLVCYCMVQGRSQYSTYACACNFKRSPTRQRNGL